MDTKIVLVALNGLDNILKVGDKDAKENGIPNPYAIEVRDCFGKFIKVVRKGSRFHHKGLVI